jgi:hypothetical protein
VYTRAPAETVYTLHEIIKITAIVHPRDPSREIWNAVYRVRNAPAVLFVVGDKTTYCNLNDGSGTAREVFGVNLTRGHATCWCRRDGPSQRVNVHDECSIVFCRHGLLHTLPIPDMPRCFPASFPAATLKRDMCVLVGRQVATYERLQHNVQFIDLSKEMVVSSVRFEGGVVAKKRKRNACREDEGAGDGVGFCDV